MFREDKSIGGPVEIPPLVSRALKHELTAVGHRKTLPAKAVAGGPSQLEGEQQRFKSLTRDIACTRLA